MLELSLQQKMLKTPPIGKEGAAPCTEKFSRREQWEGSGMGEPGAAVLRCPSGHSKVPVLCVSD